MAINVNEFYRTYGPMVLRRCRYLLQDEEKALDAMQDVFVQILKRQKDLDDRAPSSLLYITATNVCLNHLRSEKRKPKSSTEELLFEIADSTDMEEQVLSLHFIDRLFEGEKVSTRTIAVLHYIDGFTLEETAQQVGLSVSGVRKRLRNLRAKCLKLKET
ncbi:MAG: sigma-70 family RNA polymerase sigma factor [Spirochaetales bacterium]|nr:sigma-70 family RNA polymerase sigma factor [Spirochaetales bacterium]